MVPYLILMWGDSLVLYILHPSPLQRYFILSTSRLYLGDIVAAVIYNRHAGTYNTQGAGFWVWEMLSGGSCLYWEPGFQLFFALGWRDHGQRSRLRWSWLCWWHRLFDGWRSSPSFGLQSTTEWSCFLHLRCFLLRLYPCFPTPRLTDPNSHTKFNKKAIR